MGNRSEDRSSRSAPETASLEGRGEAESSRRSRTVWCATGTAAARAWSKRKQRQTIGLALSVFGAAGLASGAQEPANANAQEAVQKTELGSLKISLRLENETPFRGAATVRVFPSNGYELLNTPVDTQGDVMFYAVPAGSYTVYVSAPGLQPVRLNTELQASGEQKVIFVVMKPGTGTREEVAPSKAAAVDETKIQAAAEPKPAPKVEAKIKEPKKEEAARKAAEEEEPGLPVDESVACPTEQVLNGAGQRIQEFLSSMEKFTATEMVEHYKVDKNGERHGPETRKFTYVVTVERGPRDTYGLAEYRDGSDNHEQFPGNIATLGLPAIALVFHPEYASDFEFQCEGLVHEGTNSYWQMHFAQRRDRPVRIESYVVNGLAFPVYLKGRAWIDLETSQLVWLESQLEEPIPAIELWEQRQKISYTGVKFAATGQEIWLPAGAEVYVERQKRRYFRRHTFKDFRLFNVDTSQAMNAPKGSYSFTNLTDTDMTGELTVIPKEGVPGETITLRFQVPARRTVIKTVGPGKDVSLPVASVGSAKFVHSGGADAVKVDVDLVKETTLDVIPEAAEN